MGDNHGWAHFRLFARRVDFTPGMCPTCRIPSASWDCACMHPSRFCKVIYAGIDLSRPQLVREQNRRALWLQIFHRERGGKKGTKLECVCVSLDSSGRAEVPVRMPWPRLASALLNSSSPKAPGTPFSVHVKLDSSYVGRQASPGIHSESGCRIRGAMCGDCSRMISSKHPCTL